MKLGTVSLIVALAAVGVFVLMLILMLAQVATTSVILVLTWLRFLAILGSVVLAIIALFRERVLGVSWTAVIALAVNIVHWFIVSRMFSVVLPA